MPKQPERHFYNDKYWYSLVAVSTLASLAISQAYTSSANGDLNPPGEVTLHADISPVLTDQARCNGGAARPCAALIRDRPEQAANFINADTNQTSPVKWPIEQHDNAAGDPITVVCQVRGQTVTSAPESGPKRSSDIWDVVQVPYKYYAVSRQNLQQSPLLSYGYAADLLLGNQGIIADLARCTPDHNPADALPVK